MHDENATPEAQALLDLCVSARQDVIETLTKIFISNADPRALVYASYVALTSLADGIGSILTNEEIAELNRVSVSFGEKDIATFRSALAHAVVSAVPTLERGGDA